MNFGEYIKIREEKFGAVIFETLKEKVFVTNETGKDIVRLLEEEQPIDKIVKSLADSYGTQAQDIRDDVISFINQLKDNGIIEL